MAISSGRTASSGANELIVTGGHVGTHIDAFSHISFRAIFTAASTRNAAQAGGRFRHHGVETIAPIIARGLLLDVPAVLGIDRCAPAYEVTKADLEAAMSLTGTKPRPGDVILVRTGWATALRRPRRLREPEGRHARPRRERARHGWRIFDPRAMGSDTIAFETHTADRERCRRCRSHRLLLVERGIHIIEILALEEIAAKGVRGIHFRAQPAQAGRRDRLAGAAACPPLEIQAARAEMNEAAAIQSAVVSEALRAFASSTRPIPSPVSSAAACSPTMARRRSWSSRRAARRSGDADLFCPTARRVRYRRCLRISMPARPASGSTA